MDADDCGAAPLQSDEVAGRRGLGVSGQRYMIFKEDMQAYAKVTKELGRRSVKCLCSDGKERISYIRGKLKGKVLIHKGDIVLISLRDFDDRHADVIHKYNDEEFRFLQARNQIPDSFLVKQ